MKIVSSFMNEINLKRNQYHTIMFESSYMQQEFRLLINNYFATRRNSKLEENNYLKIIDKNLRDIDRKDIYFISFECNKINLKEDRQTDQLIKNYLFYYLENNPEIIHDYIQFQQEVEMFIERIKLTDASLSIEFDLTERSIQNFIKSLDIYMEYDKNEYVPNYILRNRLIQLLLKLNYAEKDVILLISYPETDVGLNDFEKVIQNLKALNLTTVVLTSEPSFLTSAEPENIFMINQQGVLYDIVKLKEELKAFQLVHENNSTDIVNWLAYCDFTQQFTVLDLKWKEFLESEKL